MLGDAPAVSLPKPTFIVASKAATELLKNSRPPDEPPPASLEVAKPTVNSRPPAEPPPVLPSMSRVTRLSSFDDDESFGSASEIEEILGADNDIDAPLRWARQVPHSLSSNTAHICTAQVLSLPDDDPDTNHTKWFPPGSILDPLRPPSPTDVRDFPELTVHPLPAHAPH